MLETANVVNTYSPIIIALQLLCNEIVNFLPTIFQTKYQSVVAQSTKSWFRPPGPPTQQEAKTKGRKVFQL